MFTQESKEALKREVVSILVPSMDVREFLLSSSSGDHNAGDAMRRMTLCLLLLKAVKENLVDKGNVTEILAAARDPNMHDDLLHEIQELITLGLLQDHISGLMRANDPETGQKNHAPDTSLIKRFVLGVPTGPGPLVKEFLEFSEGTCDYLEDANIYEFDWGFIAEWQNDGATSYDLFSAEAWRNEEYEGLFAGRFFQHFLLWRPDTIDGPMPNLKRGYFSFSSLSFESTEEVKPPQCRTWIAAFLEAQWPTLLAAVLSHEADG